MTADETISFFPCLALVLLTTANNALSHRTMDGSKVVVPPVELMVSVWMQKEQVVSDALFRSAKMPAITQDYVQDQNAGIDSG